MLGERYVVKPGDSLWKIAATSLGGGGQWPRIWRYNNRRDVIRETGRGIADPDLIYVGQVLILPKLPEEAGVQTPATTRTTSPSAQPLRSTTAPGVPAAGSPAPGGSLNKQLPAVQSPISFKYRLDDLRWPPLDVGTALIEVRMTGDVLLMTKRAYPAVYVTSRGEIEAQVTREANHEFGKLINDTRYVFDPVEKRMTVRTMLVSQSKNPNAPATAIGVEMSSNSPMPKLRAEIRLPKLEGSIGSFNYVAMDVKIVIEITPKLPPGSGPSPQPLRVPVRSPAPAPGTDWTKVIGTGLVITAGVIVVATLVEDFFTAGAGVADDPASFALAGASFARGLAMVRGAAVLPMAASPAALQWSGSVGLAGAGR